MIFVFEHATVNDFDQWYKVFVDFGPTLKAKGAVRSTLYRGIDNPNEVTVIHEFETRDAAQALVDSSEIHQARHRANLTTGPDIWLTEKA
jgi:uncharacterized protein YciI